jgi:hypothetical protein
MRPLTRVVPSIVKGTAMRIADQAARGARVTPAVRRANAWPADSSHSRQPAPERERISALPGARSATPPQRRGAFAMGAAMPQLRGKESVTRHGRAGGPSREDGARRRAATAASSEGGGLTAVARAVAPGAGGQRDPPRGGSQAVPPCGVRNRRGGAIGRTRPGSQ